MAALPEEEVVTLGTSTPAAAADGVLALGSSFLVRQGACFAVQSMTNIHPETDTTAFSDLQVEETDDATVLARKAYLGAGSDEDEEPDAFMSLLIGPFDTDTNIRLIVRTAEPDTLSVAGLARLVRVKRNSQTA